MPHKLSAVKDTHARHSDDAGAKDFTPARVACHQMRLNQPDDDFQVRFNIPPVKQNRHLCACPAQIGVAFNVCCDMVFNPIVFNDKIAEHFNEFVSQVWSVSSCRYQDGYLVALHASLFQPLEQGRQNQRVRNWTGLIANDDAGASLSFRQIPQRRSAYRIVKGILNRSLRVVKGRDGLKAANSH